MDGLTAELIAARVAEMHAKRYPNGCGATWGSGCDACCERLGANPPGPVFAFLPVKDVFGRTAHEPHVIGAWLVSGASLRRPFTHGSPSIAHGFFYATGDTVQEAYTRALAAYNTPSNHTSSHGRRIV